MLDDGSEQWWCMAFLLRVTINKPLQLLDDVEIIVPNSLQMGWCKSPTFSRSSSEIARDIMGNIFPQKLPQHKFESIMMQEPCKNGDVPPPSTPIYLLEVYVDDFICMTNDLRGSHCWQLSHAILHGIHTIFHRHQSQDTTVMIQFRNQTGKRGRYMEFC